MIQLETTQFPFSISFKQDNLLLMTVQTSATPKANPRTDNLSVSAISSLRFAL